MPSIEPSQVIVVPSIEPSMDRPSVLDFVNAREQRAKEEGLKIKKLMELAEENNETAFCVFLNKVSFFFNNGYTAVKPFDSFATI